MPVAQKKGSKNGTLLHGTKDQNLRNPGSSILSHTQLPSPHPFGPASVGGPAGVGASSASREEAPAERPQLSGSKGATVTCWKIAKHMNMDVCLSFISVHVIMCPCVGVCVCTLIPHPVPTPDYTYGHPHPPLPTVSYMRVVVC